MKSGRILGVVKGVLLTERQRTSLQRRIDGRSVLEWVIRQVSDAEQLDGVVLLTDSDYDAEVVRRFAPSDVPVAIADAMDTLSCLRHVVDQFPADSYVFLGADWPFVDPAIIDQLVSASRRDAEYHYVAFRFANECFSIHRPFGLFPEWYSAAAIRSAHTHALDKVHRNLPGTFFIDNAADYRIEMLPAPLLLDRLDTRLTVATEEDWENAMMLHEAMGNDVCDLAKVSVVLKEHPQMRQRMASANSVAKQEHEA
ncbi:MAG: NTP transferase domain-containing protein [Thermoguttaceae bacterium]